MPQLNGVPVTPDDLQSLALTNYGHYTSMRAEGRYVRELSLHLDQLVHGCRLVFNAAFGALRRRRAAQLGDCDDVLFTDEKSFVSVGATWNVGFFDGDRVIWPDAEVLPAVAIRLIDQVHEHSGTAPVNVTAIGTVHAAFATNTTIGVRAIRAINDLTPPADRPIFDTLRKEYMESPAEWL